MAAIMERMVPDESPSNDDNLHLRCRTAPSTSANSFFVDDDRQQNERIKVYVRMRPLASHETLHPSVEIASTSTTLRVPSTSGQTQMECSFDHIFPPLATQEDLYASVKPLVADVMDGYNATIFAYGQTGTGKTHTILGMDNPTSTLLSRGASTPPDMNLSSPSWGIIPRALCQLVDALSTYENCSISCAYLQIYNEKIFDLLTDKKRQRPLTLREALDGSSEMVVQGLSSCAIASQSDVLSFLKRGHLHRVVRETDMNSQSSRSHAILQVTFKLQSPNGLRKAKLNLVDLAGSEKWNKNAMKPGVEIEEMKNINTSLSALGNCIAALTQPGRKHIPYRDSSLTRLLQDSLGGNTRTVLIATITARASDETIRTIQFADRTRAVMQCVVMSQVVPMSPRQLQLGLTAARAHIAKLKSKLQELAEQKEKHADYVERVNFYEAQMREKEHAIESLVAQNEEYQKKLKDGEQQIQKLQQKIQALSATPSAMPMYKQRCEAADNNQLDPINYQTPSQTSSKSFTYSPGHNSKVALPHTNGDLYTISSKFKALYGGNKSIDIATVSKPLPLVDTPSFSLGQSGSFMTTTTTPSEQVLCQDHKLKGCVLCALRQKSSNPPPSSNNILPSSNSVAIFTRPSPRTIIPALKKSPSMLILQQSSEVCTVHQLNRCVLCNRKPVDASTPNPPPAQAICTPHGLGNCVLCARNQRTLPLWPSQESPALSNVFR